MTKILSALLIGTALLTATPVLSARKAVTAQNGAGSASETAQSHTSSKAQIGLDGRIDDARLYQGGSPDQCKNSRNYARCRRP